MQLILVFIYMNSDMVTDTVIEWFQNLNYEYMILHVIVCYGLYYSANMRWIVEWFSPVRKKGRSRAVWLVGGVLALLEIARYLPFVGEGGLTVDIYLSVIHSYIVIQVFVDPIVSTVHRWFLLFKKTTDDNISSK